MEPDHKETVEVDEVFRVMDRWPLQPEGKKPRLIPWHNLLAAVRRSHIEMWFPVWCDLAPVPNNNAGQQLKHRLTGNGRLKKELPRGSWAFRVRTRPDGIIALQGCYHWVDNWNALLGTPGLLDIEHQFFRRFRKAFGQVDEHVQVQLDWYLWASSLDHPVSPLDPIYMERLQSPSN